ncbi:MAG TPA: methionyl-tRNA formyltransferase [Candidatus Saccharimonadales bacterium]|jgi:methionyl-tRNA formyltransferase
MKKTSETIVFFGNERLATGVTTTAPTLQALINTGYHVSAVVSNYAEHQPRDARALEVGIIAKQNNIPILLPNKPLDILALLKGLCPAIGVLVAYGKIVPREIIDVFPHGIVNIHPSLLPLHRGPTPIESVVLSGASETGVSLMRLIKTMDAGPVFSQEKITLSGRETKQELAAKLLNIGKTLLIDHLPAILSGTLQPTQQNSTLATYDTRINKADGIVNWNKPAEQLEREIRAYSGWPKSHTELAGRKIIVTKARVVEIASIPGKLAIRDKSLVIGTKHNGLGIEMLVPAGKKEMTAAAFLAGYGRTLQ